MSNPNTIGFYKRLYRIRAKFSLKISSGYNVSNPILNINNRMKMPEVCYFGNSLCEIIRQVRLSGGVSYLMDLMITFAETEVYV